MWRANTTVAVETNEVGSATIKFLEQLEGEGITATREYHIKALPLAVLDSALKLFSEHQISTPMSGAYIVTGWIDGFNVLFTLATHRNDYDEIEEQINEDTDSLGEATTATLDHKVVNYRVSVTADRRVIRKVFSYIANVYRQDRLPVIKWWYEDPDSPRKNATYRRIFMERPKTELRAEYYPTLPGGPKKFMKNYLEADASVLLVAGPPGTGKTTLIRHLISDYNLSAHIVYEERLMESDNIFQAFLFERDSDLLIIEDADTIILSRDKDKNKLMARFLNVSDGLIKLPNKKLVFTTNLDNFERVDQALLRPGRCYGQVHMRLLTYTEAQTAANVARLPMPTDEREYSLAELFNRATPAPIVRRFGFTRGAA